EVEEGGVLDERGLGGKFCGLPARHPDRHGAPEGHGLVGVRPRVADAERAPGAVEPGAVRCHAPAGDAAAGVEGAADVVAEGLGRPGANTPGVDAPPDQENDATLRPAAE